MDQSANAPSLRFASLQSLLLRQRPSSEGTVALPLCEVLHPWKKGRLRATSAQCRSDNASLVYIIWLHKSRATRSIFTNGRGTAFCVSQSQVSPELLWIYQSVCQAALPFHQIIYVTVVMFSKRKRTLTFYILTKNYNAKRTTNLYTN